MLTKTTVRCYYTFFKRAKLKKNNRKHQVLLRIQCHGDLSYTVSGTVISGGQLASAAPVAEPSESLKRVLNPSSLCIPVFCS